MFSMYYVGRYYMVSYPNKLRGSNFVLLHRPSGKKSNFANWHYLLFEKLHIFTIISNFITKILSSSQCFLLCIPT